MSPSTALRRLRHSSATSLTLPSSGDDAADLLRRVRQGARLISVVRRAKTKAIVGRARVPDGGLYAKPTFAIDLPTQTVTCPAGQRVVTRSGLAPSTPRGAWCTSCLSATCGTPSTTG